MKRFLDKVMSIFGYKNPTLTWDDFNSEIKNLILRKWIITIIIVIAFIAMAIVSNNAFIYVVFFIFIIITVASPLSLYYSFRCDRVYIIDGICTEVSKKANRLAGQVIRYGKSTITVEDDSNVYIVPVPHYSMFAEKKKVRIYFFQEDVYRKADNVYSLYNPVLVLPMGSIDS